MSYEGQTRPRYLVWHLDHISYTIVDLAPGDRVAAGARIRANEALGRDPSQLVDLTLLVEQLNAGGAIIAKRAVGLSVVRLENRFEGRPGEPDTGRS